MPSEAVLAGVAFAVMFGMWVVLPTILRRRHERQEATEGHIEQS